MKTSEKTDRLGKLYEVGCLFVPIIADKDVLTEVSKIKDTLEGLDCEFVSGDGPQLKSLSYPMEKMIGGNKQIFKEAYFVWLKFRCSADKLKTLQDSLDKIEYLLRYLLIKTTEKDVLLSEQKKVIASKEQTKKKEKIVKPVEITKTDDFLKKEADTSSDSENDKEDIDKTIDELVIK